MRVLSQSEIDILLSKMLTDASILPGSQVQSAPSAPPKPPAAESGGENAQEAPVLADG